MRTLKKRLKNALLQSVIWLTYYSGALTLAKGLVNRFQLVLRDDQRRPWPALLRLRVRNIQILTYHRVNDEYDAFFPAVPVRVFAEQMDYLAHQCHVLSLEEAVARLLRRDVPENAVVITFDDGYRDNYLNAFPVLQQLSLPATIFLATDAIDGNAPLWHDRVFAAFRKTRQRELRNYFPGSGGTSYALSSVGDKLAVQRRVLAFLRTLDVTDRDAWIERLMDRLGVEEPEPDPRLMLAWSEIKEMASHGIAFGSHTMSHPILSRLAPERLRAEILGSKKAIESQLGVEVSAFAYPNGTQDDFTPTAKEMVRECGYQCGVTTIFGTNGEGQDVYELRRGGPWERHLPTFAVKLSWYKFFSGFPCTVRSPVFP